MAGAVPATAADVNNAIGGALRQFVLYQAEIARYEAWLAGVDLTQPPYSMSTTDSANIQSAISGLNTSLQGVSLTFINRLVGLF